MDTRERSERELEIRLHDRGATGVTVDPAKIGWGNFVAGCVEHIEVDPTEVCKWFDQERQYVIRKGDVHTSIEPATAHIHAHGCGTGPAYERACAAARAIISLELTVRQLREIASLKPMLEELRSSKKELDGRIATLERMVPRHWSRIPADQLSFDQGAKVIEGVAHTLESLKGARSDIERLLGRYVLSPELMKLRSTDRPALVSAEAELQENELFSAGEVCVLLRDCRGPVDPAGAVRSRRNNPAQFIQVVVRGHGQLHLSGGASVEPEEPEES